MNKVTCDVCVVGAGPAGCFAGFHLAQAGFEVVVLEEHETIGEPVDCSGIIGREAFDVLSLPRTSIIDELSTIELVAPSGETVRFDPPGPLAYVVDRAEFDRSLADLALAAGATVWTSSVARSLRVERSGSIVSVQREGQELSIRAKALILAHGPRYRFQDQLGMGRPSRFLKTVQAEMPFHTPCHPMVFFGRAIASGSFAWFLPVSRGRCRLVKIGISTTSSENQRAFTRFVDLLTHRGLLNGEQFSSKGWLIPITPIPRSFANGALAVGDAAGQTKPMTGGGLYYGLLCARIAAETLSEALREGDVSSKRLAAYEQRWKQQLGKEIAMAALFRWVAERLSDRGLNQVIHLARQDGFMRLVERRADFDWHSGLIVGMARKPRFAVALLQEILRSWLPA